LIYLYESNNLIYEKMKKITVVSLLIPVFLVLGLLLVNFRASDQDNSKAVTTIPDEVNKIVTASCTPCHTSEGGVMSKSKLNFTAWTNYSPEKQKEKAAKMYSELNKGAMPPKAARQKRPDLIPTKEQVAIIKKWSESFPADNKK
jgi:mono/diheme cytochrome c family protein